MIPRRAILAAGGGLAVSAGSFYAGMRFGRGRQPRLNRLTERRGTVNSARFAPDGRTIFYSAAWEGAPSRVFCDHQLDIPPATLASISRHGELAVILEGSSNLARVSPGGGTPHEVVRNIIAADWSPDATSFLIVRVAGSKQRIEFPIGKVIYQTSDSIPMARLSPDGRRIAFFETSPGLSLKVIEADGAARTLLAHWRDPAGLAWAPDGSEIWFSAAGDGNPPAIRAADFSGAIRPILQLTQGTVIDDTAADGRALFTAHDRRVHMMCRRTGESTERDLSWGDTSLAADISADGGTILFGEPGAVLGAVLVRKTDGSPAESCGPGDALALSPDGQSAAILNPAAPRQRWQLQIVPAGGPGDGRVLASDRFTYAGARWFPDGKRLLVYGNEDGRLPRHYVQEIGGGPPRAITPEGSAEEAAIAPDGQDVAVRSGPGVFLFPVDGGQPEPVRRSGNEDRPVAWSDDAGSIYLRRGSTIERVDWKTGESDVWKDLTPLDPAGVVRIGRFCMTPDGAAYVYSYERDLSSLYLAEGLR